MDASFH